MGGHVACIEEILNVNKVLIGEDEGKRQLGKEDNI
jgi:hypothetical protein